MAARCLAFAAAAAAPAMCAGGRRLLSHAPPLGPCRSPPHVAGGARRRPALLLRPALAPMPVRAAVPSPTRGSRMAAEGGGGANGGTDGTGDPPGVVTTLSTADAAAPAPAPAPPSPRPAKPTYSQATRLREETEAPFRKARMFVFGASAASAGVGGLVAASRVIAAAVGVRGVQPLDETLPNLAVNLGVLVACAFLLRQEVRTGERRLSRLARGASLARLKVSVPGTGRVTKLGALRSKRRMVILAGRAPALTAAVSSAEPYAQALYDRRILVVPLLLPSAADAAGSAGTEAAAVAAADGSAFTSGNWIATPVLGGEWLDWFASEKKAAGVDEAKAADEVLVVIVKFNGKVGGRSMGNPTWKKLVGDIDAIVDGEGPPTRTREGGGDGDIPSDSREV